MNKRHAAAALIVATVSFGLLGTVVGLFIVIVLGYTKSRWKR